MKKVTSWKNIKIGVLDMLFILLGTLIYALGVTIFIQPNHFTPGGITGIAVQLNYLFELPTGVLIIVLNIPIFILGFVFLGKKFILCTATATVVSSVAIDIFAVHLPTYTGDPVLVAIFGGLLMGFGVSLLYLRGASLGGSDIISSIINKKAPWISVGKIVLGFNCLVILSAAIVYKNIDSALYSAVASFVHSKALDVILLGKGSGKMVLAITKRPYELAEKIHDIVGRGATVVPVKGSYKHEPKSLLLSVSKRYEIAKITRTIKELDPEAFIIACDAAEILGNGFVEKE